MTQLCADCKWMQRDNQMRPRRQAAERSQAADVFRLMRDGQWRTLAEIAEATGHPEASVSARLRDLRKPSMGGLRVDREYVSRGLWRYRVMA